VTLTLFLISYALLWVLVIVQGFAFLEVVRQLAHARDGAEFGRSPARAQLDLNPGELLPTIVMGMADHPEVRIPYALPESTTLLVVLNPGCYTCQQVGRGMDRIRRQQSDVRLAVVIEAGSLEQATRLQSDAGIPSEMVLYDVPPSLSKALGLDARPAVIETKGDVFRGAWNITSATELELLVARLAATLPAVAGPVSVSESPH